MKIYHEPSLRKKQQRRMLVAVLLGFMASSTLHLVSDGSEVIATAHAADHAAADVPLMLTFVGEAPTTTPSLNLKMSTRLTNNLQ